MVVSAVFGIAIPVVLFLFFRKKYKADIVPFFIGCAVFFLFAVVLESFVSILFIGTGIITDIGKTIQGNIWLSALMGGIMAGLFEETGRFAAFKTVLRKYRGNDVNALMYGAGHGGFEAFLVLFFTMLSNIFVSILINANMMGVLEGPVTDDIARMQAISNTAKMLSETPSLSFLAGPVERFAAVAVHISLSVLVWFAAKKGGVHVWFYPLSILLHSLVNFVAVVALRYIGNVWLVEVIVYIITACYVLLAIQIWKKYSTKPGVVYEAGSAGAAAGKEMTEEAATEVAGTGDTETVVKGEASEGTGETDKAVGEAAGAASEAARTTGEAVMEAGAQEPNNAELSAGEVETGETE